MTRRHDTPKGQVKRGNREVTRPLCQEIWTRPASGSTCIPGAAVYRTSPRQTDRPDPEVPPAATQAATGRHEARRRAGVPCASLAQPSDQQGLAVVSGLRGPPTDRWPSGGRSSQCLIPPTATLASVPDQSNRRSSAGAGFVAVITSDTPND